MATNESSLHSLTESANLLHHDGGVLANETDGDGRDKFGRLFRPGYRANLISRWIPALEGVEAKLREDARVADVGCGIGSATILMAEAFPRSHFFGFDANEDAIEAAKHASRVAGVTDRVYFQLGSLVDFPGWEFDLITFFDSLRDAANPEAAARRVRSALAPNGVWMIVEARAGEQVQSATNGSGPVAGEKKIRQVLEAAGFTQFRRAAETPFNVVFEARV